MYPNAKRGVLGNAWRFILGGRGFTSRWYGASGINMYYRRARLVTVGRYPHPLTSRADVVAAVDDILGSLERMGALTHDDDTIVAVTLPEFALNAGSTRPAWGAHAPLALPLYETFFDKVKPWMLSLSPGIVLGSGGTAVDTGEAFDDGTVRGLNLGFLMESGEDGAVIPFSTYHHDAADGWDRGRFRPDLADWRVVPRVHNFPGLLTMAATCLDLRLAKLPDAFRRARLIVSGPAGGAVDWRVGRLNDATDGSTVMTVSEARLAADGYRVTGGSSVPDGPRYPWLAGLRELTGRAGVAGALLATAEHVFSLPAGEAIGPPPDSFRWQTDLRTPRGVIVRVSDTVALDAGDRLADLGRRRERS